ncbi:ImmA/IrrE family metallo-endopeptidase [Streptomyces sp. PmtA]|uniref:ImmA/IrrE family metallo-endopeptidase n=1 Tax=Streptomyces sp. PmtA TaxID=3074275 RepID=UPI0030152798
MLYDWIDERFRLPAVDVPSLGKPDPETAAGMVRTRWGLGEAPAPNMVHLLESHGVRVFSLDPDHAEVDAFAVWRDGVPFVFLNTLKSAERGRFDAAHELGHLVMHGSEHVCSGPEAERQANDFASAFLMPRASVLGHMPSGAHVDQIIRGKRIWKVSAMALTYRMHDLGLLTDWQYRSTCAELSRLGYRSDEPEGMGQRESSQVLTKVFTALRTKHVRPSGVAAELGLTGEEMNRLLFGLTLTTFTGGGQQDISPQNGTCPWSPDQTSVRTFEGNRQASAFPDTGEGDGSVGAGRQLPQRVQADPYGRRSVRPTLQARGSRAWPDGPRGAFGHNTRRRAWSGGRRGTAHDGRVRTGRLRMRSGLIAHQADPLRYCADEALPACYFDDTPRPSQGEPDRACRIRQQGQ